MIVLSVLVLVLIFGALVDVVLSPESRVKRGSKAGWLMTVLLLPVIGGALWFAFGRRRGDYDLDSETTDEHPGGHPDRAADQVRSVDGPIELNDDSAFPALTAGDPTSAPASASPPTARPLSTEEQLAELEAEIAFWDEWARRERPEREAPGGIHG